MELAVLLVLFVVREVFLQRERAQNSKERESLIQRIQAPELATVSYATGKAANVSGVPLLDDEDYDALLNGD